MPFITKNSIGETKLQVRATLAFMFSIAFIAGFFDGLIPPEDFKAVAMMAIVWYFSARGSQEDNKSNNNGNE